MVFNRLGGANRQGRLLHHNFVAIGKLGDLSGAELHIFQVGSPTLTHAILLCRRIHRNENHIGFLDCALHIR